MLPRGGDMSKDKSKPKPKTEVLGLPFYNEMGQSELPPGRYTAKIVQDLGNVWLFEVASGEHVGQRFVLPKVERHLTRNINGVPLSNYSRRTQLEH